MWVLGSEPWSFARKINALKHWDISLSSASVMILFFKCFLCLWKYAVFLLLPQSSVDLIFHGAAGDLEFSLTFLLAYHGPCLIVSVHLPCRKAPVFCSLLIWFFWWDVPQSFQIGFNVFSISSISGWFFLSVSISLLNLSSILHHFSYLIQLFVFSGKSLHSLISLNILITLNSLSGISSNSFLLNTITIRVVISGEVMLSWVLCVSYVTGLGFMHLVLFLSSV